ncbi:MAG: SRPBCC family protein, partial [Thermoleophilia bacterium]|nr:SRPBCC family protein [Thermoleophilia bacterium]
MSRAEHSVEIARPPAEVFPYLGDPDLMRRRSGGRVEFTP